VYVRTAEQALQPVSACVDRLNAPGGVTTRQLPRVGTLTGAPSGDVVELPSAEGTGLFVLSPPQGSPAVVLGLRTGGDMERTLFDLASITPDAEAPRNPVSPFGNPLTLHIPNGPRSIVSGSGYEAVIAGDEGDLDATLLSRVGTPARVLDVDLFYVGASGLSPLGEQGPPRVRRALAALEQTFANSRIRVGVVRQHEVVGGLRERLSVIEASMGSLGAEYPELPELYALSAGAARPSISVFLTRTIDLALGISGGIPGPMTMHGTGGSGIAIGVDSLAAPGSPVSVDLGRALAHEVGHFLGLYHTSEVNGLVLEPLPDTPECRLDSDTDGDELLLPSECGSAAGNLMFWAASGDVLSAQQEGVLRRALVLR
jgi:hypothetical protein